MQSVFPVDAVHIGETQQTFGRKSNVGAANLRAGNLKGGAVTTPTVQKTPLVHQVVSNQSWVRVTQLPGVQSVLAVASLVQSNNQRAVSIRVCRSAPHHRRPVGDR